MCAVVGFGAPRIDPFTAEAEATAVDEAENEGEAIRTAIAAIIAERDIYASQASQLRRELQSIREFLHSDMSHTR